MPREVIAHLSMEDKGRLFIEMLMRKPTNTGYFIVSAVVRELGDEFITHMALTVAEGLALLGEPVTKEAIMDGLEDLVYGWASDINTLYEFVSDYRVNVLGVDENDLTQACNPLKSEAKEPKLPTMQQVADSKHTTIKESKLRDPVTGKFIKKRG